MAIKCPSCGAHMHYDIKNNNLKCSYCEATEEIENYENIQIAKTLDTETYTDKIKVSVYQCPDCGAETQTFEEQGTLFCPYCGRQSFLKGTEMGELPHGIIPFAIDKEEAKKKIREMLKEKDFVPKDYLSEENEFNELRGIYIPYWSFDAEISNEAVALEAISEYSKGLFDVTDTYAINAAVNEIQDIAFDASEAFDDTIASNIASFDSEKIKDFNEAYAAGFYIDKATTDADIYSISSNTFDEEIRKKITDEIKEEMEKKVEGKLTVEFEPDQELKVEFKKKLNYFPVWFNTKRLSNNRVMYSIINGQSGKAVADIPVDKKKFFLSSLLLSIPFIILFYYLFTNVWGFVTPSIMAKLSLIVEIAAMVFFCSEVKKIKQKDLHMCDIGSKEYNTKKISALRHVHGAIRNLCISCIIFIASAIMAFRSTPSDEWYYLATLVSIIGVSQTILGCISAFNYLSSRPVPNFFIREGGNNNA